MPRLLLAVIPVLLLALALAVWLPGRQAGVDAAIDDPPDSIDAGDGVRLAPDFSLPDLSGQRHAMVDWKDRVLMVNFWASWCEPCRREIPAFIALQEQYRADGLQVVGVALDDAAEIARFLQAAGIDSNYPQLLAPGEDGIDLAIAWGNAVGVLPYTVFVDRSGHVVHAHYGELTMEAAAERFRPLL